MELAAGLFDDYQLPVLWEHGKRIHVPGLVLFVVLLRISQCDKVTQRPCDDIVFSFYISICFLLQCKTRAMSLPTEGFSAMTRCFIVFLLFLFKIFRRYENLFR